MPEVVTANLLGLVLLGFVNGGSICALSCLHYLGPYLVTGERGFKSGLKGTASYLLGKLIGYGLFGLLAGIFGEFALGLSKAYGTQLLGIALIGLALALLLQKKSCPKAGGKLWGLGLSSSLIPCPALGVMLVAAVSTGTALGGLSMGLAYGVGLNLSPLLLYGGALGYLGSRLMEEMRRLEPWLKGASVLVIFILGMKLLMEAGWNF